MPAEMKGARTLRKLKGVNRFLRKHKLISKGATVVSKVGPKKYRATAAKSAAIAKQLGYGLRLAGAGKKKKKRRRGRPCGK